MGCSRLAAVVCLGAMAFSGVSVRVWSQQPVACHGGGDTEVADPATLPAPVKMTGIGNGSIEITAANDEAKAWFTQGLNLLHDFWDYESARAFQQAVRVDPKCAMCYWGLYQAGSFRGQGVGMVWARSALTKAQELAKDKKRASKAERLYIEAAVADSKEKAERSKHGPNTAGAGKTDAYKDSKETKILRKLVQMKPEDVQARIYLAESMMNGFDAKGEPKAGTAQGQALLVEILKEHPDDSAANHYWIHAVEPGNHPELALDSAKKLGPLTPASGHMVHMPGHIFYRTGDYETARASFEDSMHVDETYMRDQNVTVANDWNYVHNLMYLIADLTEAGRLAEATAISAKLTNARAEVGPTLYRQTPRDGLTRIDVRLPVMLRAGAWRAARGALEAKTLPGDLKNLEGLRESMVEYTGGMLALEMGDVAAARKASDALAARVKDKPVVPAEDMPGMAAMTMSKDAMVMPLHNFLDVASMELAASVLLAEGRGVESDVLFTKASDAERELGYREPPMYIRPVGETRGDALMRAKRYDEAKTAYEAALKERPNSGYPLFGIAQADVAAKRSLAATADYARLLDAWAKADADLPQMQVAREWMAGQAVSGE